MCIVSAFCVPSLPSLCSESFQASVLGVKTHITLQKRDLAVVCVSGFGFQENGVARLVNNELQFDDSFDAFLRSKRVKVLGILEHTSRHISIRVRIPFLGHMTVRLLRDVNFGYDFGR